MKIGIVSILVLTAIGLVLGLAIAGLPPGIVAGILCAAALFYLVFFRPVIAIALLLAAVPLNILWLGVGVTPQEIIYGLAYLLLFVAWIIKKIRRFIFSDENKDISSPITLPLIVFLCVSIFSCVIGISRGHKFPEWGSDLNAISYYSLCFIILDITEDKKNLYSLFIVMLFAAVAGILKEIFYLIKGIAFYGMAYIETGLVGLRNVNIIALPLLLICVAFTVNTAKGTKKGLFAIASVFFGLAQIICFARALWVAAVAGLAFLVLMSTASQKINFLKFTAAGVLIFSLFMVAAELFPSSNVLSRLIYSLEKRYASIFIAKQEPSIITRGSEWKAATKKVLEHPFFGNGLGTQVEYYRSDVWYGYPTWERTRYIHNAYLSIFLNMGLVGLVSFLWFCFTFMRYGLGLGMSLKDETDRALCRGITAGFFAMMVVSFAGPILISPFNTMWLGFFIGALIIIDRSRAGS
ncbi:MAG: O-antigen ligase family protein [Candidatus Omnitrophica bacterium]|nr:O-antigen ligase family protein [Candidatus Omnitrophota bacterium]